MTNEKSLVLEGQSKQEVIDYMIDRYGYFVHYQPPVTPLTILLWVLPIFMLILGFITIIVKQRNTIKKESWGEAQETELESLIKKYYKKGRNDD